MANPIVKLEYPITINGTKVDSITLRRPTVRDIKAAKRQGGSDDVEVETALIANLSGLSPEEIESLALSDYTAIQEVIMGFQARGKSRD